MTHIRTMNFKTIVQEQIDEYVYKYGLPHYNL